MLTEVPAFQFQSKLLAVVPVDIVLNVSMLLLAARLAAYSLLTRASSPWAVLPIELLHGAGALDWGGGHGAGERGREERADAGAEPSGRTLPSVPQGAQLHTGW